MVSTAGCPEQTGRVLSVVWPTVVRVSPPSSVPDLNPALADGIAADEEIEAGVDRSAGGSDQIGSDPVDSADSGPTGSGTGLGASGWKPLFRLAPWIRPYRGSMIFMMVTAFLAMVAQVLVPLVVQQVVDGPIRHHDTHRIWGPAALALGLGVAEAFFFFLRRWAMATTALGIEADLRRDIYDHVQKLPVEFHDRWSSGQLLSRMTTDLSTLRRFLGSRSCSWSRTRSPSIVVVVLLLRIHLRARTVRRRRDDPDGGRRPVLREPLQPRGPPGPGPDRRPGHRRRGIRARHPGDQVLRPPSADAGPVHRRREHAAHGRAGQGDHPGRVLHHARGLPADRAGRGDLRRRGRRRPRLPFPRRVRGVRDAVPAPDLAAGLDGLAARRHAGGGERVPADLRDPRRGTVHRRSGGAAEHASAGPEFGPARERVVPLSRRRRAGVARSRTWTSAPARRWPWSARPDRARPPSPRSSPGCTTSARDG